MKRTIRDYNLENKRVIIRVDFNVPIKDGKITDDTRIQESLPTIQYAINSQAKIILLSHLGRIKEEADLEKNSLSLVAIKLSQLLSRRVIFVNKTRGKEVENIIHNMQNGDIVLLENTRFEDLDGQKESSNDSELAEYWASFGKLFINDAFGTIHRSHASNVGIATYLPSGIGLLVEKELKALSNLENPERPYVVILGGAKVSDKIGVIENLISKCDKIVIGGAMAFTFLKAKGYRVGKSLVEDENLDFCQRMINEYPEKLVLPMDIVVSKEISDQKGFQVKAINQLEVDDIGLDLGPHSIQQIQNILKETKTVMWNGPLGYYEIETYQKATKEILEYLVENNITTVLGGGDIVAASSQLGYKDKVSHASTGGGATLEYLEGKELPGLTVITDK